MHNNLLQDLTHSMNPSAVYRTGQSGIPGTKKNQREESTIALKTHPEELS